MKKINLYLDPCQESIWEELPQQEIAMDLSTTILDVADSLKLILRNWSEIEKSLSHQSLPPLISDDMAENDVTRSWKTFIIFSLAQSNKINQFNAHNP